MATCPLDTPSVMSGVWRWPLRLCHFDVSSRIYVITPLICHARACRLPSNQQQQQED